MKPQPAPHKFRPGDYLCDRHFYQCSGFVIRRLYGGGKYHKFLCYEVNHNGKIEIAFENQVRYCYAVDENGDAVIMVAYDAETKDWTHCNAPIEYINRVRPELLTKLN